MPTTQVQIYRSNTSGNTPPSLIDGQIAVNQSDGVLFWRTAAALVQKLLLPKRATTADAAYTIKSSDTYIGVTSLTLARVMTLPAASAYPVGHPLTIADESGACSATLTITVKDSGGTTIATLARPKAAVTLWSTGALWTVAEISNEQMAAHIASGPLATALAAKVNAANPSFSGNMTSSGFVFSLSGAGQCGVEIGRIDGTASFPFWDFHSGASAVDFDARIYASGGTGTAGGGTLTVQAGAFTFNGNALWHAGNLDGTAPTDTEFATGTSTTKRPTVAQVQTQVAAILSGTVPPYLPPRRGQFISALEASGTGRTATVAGAVPSDPGDATNRAWNHTVFVTQTCALAQFVKTTLGLTDTQLTTIISNARSVSE